MSRRSSRGQEGPSLGPEESLPEPPRVMAHDRQAEILLWVGLVALVTAAFLMQTVSGPSGEAVSSSTPNLDPATAQRLGAILLALATIGCGLLVWAASAAARGELQARFSRWSSGPRIALLETFFCFLIGAQLLGGLIAWLSSLGGGLWPLWFQFLLFGVLFWPRLRGVSNQGIQWAAGLAAGFSIKREISMGCLAYIAALPILGMGLALSAWVSKWSTAPYHPVVDWLSEGRGIGETVTWVALAVVWAPLAEEIFFRGVFHTYLRDSLGFLGSAATSALFFAALHPQGIAGIPFLFTLGFVLAAVREWRGSIIACVTMHFIHNGITLTLMTVLMR